MDGPLQSSSFATPTFSKASAVSAEGVATTILPHSIHPAPLSPRSPQSPQSPSSPSSAGSPPATHDAPLRQPRAAKKASAKDDDLRAAIDRQVLADEQRAAIKHHSQQQLRLHSSPALPASPLGSPSPPASPMNMSTTKEAPRQDRIPPMAHRTASIDSAVSSISSTTSTTQRPNGSNAYRVPNEAAGQMDGAALIVAAGSAEAALQKLINEKQQAASHNAQLWRLVEKQRAMILGLNKDLEKALKEKERYRKKLKDHLAQSASAPALFATARGADALNSQDSSPSSSQLGRSSELSRDIVIETRKTGDSPELVTGNSHRSDTPQDAITAGLRATPQPVSSQAADTREMNRADAAGSIAGAGHPGNKAAQHALATNKLSTSADATPVALSPATPHNTLASLSTNTSQLSPPPSAQSFSSPKTRKAPPAPLKLEGAKSDPHIMNNIIDASDSEYEEDPESARSEFVERGRRKTREEDDREREAVAREEEEQRSRSKKDKKSRSRPAIDKVGAPLAPPIPRETATEVPRQTPAIDAMANPAEIIRNRAASDATGLLLKSTTVSSLLSPGLPMSPRPGDRPPNSPMPRPPNAATNSIPMSPRAGLPLSPRAPRQPIPPPPQTPLSLISPHLDRAKAYHQQMQAQPQSMSSLAGLLKPSPDISPQDERTTQAGEPTPPGAENVYQGLVSEQYPDLLLPPNALPSIYVKTASSRMKPSRASYIQPKPMEDNPVFTLAVHARSDNKQLWRTEKTFAALQALDLQVKAIVVVRDRLPDKQLFAGHAPAKIDARRMALNVYFERLLDAVNNEKAALAMCKFLSTDAIGSDSSDYFGALDQARSDSPANQKLRPNMAGYLTKRGKNFGGWKARYFVLDGPSLKYFEGRGGAHLGSIKLQNAQIGKQSSNATPAAQEDEDNQFRHAFLILEPKKKDSTSLVRHVLCAESDEERDVWVDALLQYVDYRDDEDQLPARQAQVSKNDISGPRSPRLQKSMNDLRPGTSHDRDAAAQSRSIDQVRSVGYNETVAGEAPVMGPPASPRFPQTPSPPFDRSASGQTDQTSHPTISGPTNLHVIQNAGEWGNKAPPTPGARDKKRGMFSNLPFSRGRSSSDVAPADLKSAAYAPSSSRGVFGVPLSEAVASAHVADAATDLPAVVYRCIEYLTIKNAVSEEGIFRLSGSSTVIKTLKERFNSEGDVDLVNDDNYHDVHAVAGLLKLYLRELPASILTRDLHLDFLSCLELPGDDKVRELNKLVNKLPSANRALLEALSAFMVQIIDNVGVNKMNVRNLGVVFSPTLNLPGPLISLFVEEQRRIFRPDTVVADVSPPVADRQTQPSSNDLRSPRRQMFSELPTPAYNQTQFHHSISGRHLDDTGMTPMQPTYAQYQMAPQGEGGFGSLNDALRSPTVYGTTGTGEPTPRDIKAKRRESGMLLANNTAGVQKTPIVSRLREEQGTSF